MLIMRVFLCLCLGVATCLSISPSSAQAVASQPSDATAILQQVTQVFSGGKAIHQIQITGNAEWHAGGLNDSGSAALTATATGSAQMQLSLAKKGSWTESQTNVNAGMGCQWTGSDGIAHDGDALNCTRPAVWFLPSISLQSAMIPSEVGVADMGTNTVGSGTYRHLQAQAVFSGMPSSSLDKFVQASTTDIGINPNTLLPSVLTYRIHPDNGAQVDIPVEIRYSNYQKVDGVEIPFLIQRYVNGSLQLEIQVTSAQIS